MFPFSVTLTSLGITKIINKIIGHLKQRTNSLEKTLMLGRLRAGGEAGDRGWNVWIASPTQWTWIWANSRRQWKTGKPGVLQSMGSQKVGHNLATEKQQQQQNNRTKRSRHCSPTSHGEESSRDMGRSSTWTYYPAAGWKSWAWKYSSISLILTPGSSGLAWLPSSILSFLILSRIHLSPA